MKVIAKEKGFYNGIRRRVGDVFEVADGAKGSWFEPFKGQKPPKRTPKEQEADEDAKAKAGVLAKEQAIAKAQAEAEALQADGLLD